MDDDDVARPPHQPDPAVRRQVEALAAYGVPETDIARVVGIDPKTLRKHYRDELDTGHIKANGKVAESLFRKATGDGSQSVTAAIFWLKTRARWKETQVQESSGPEGGAVQVEYSDEHIARAFLCVLHRVFANQGEAGQALKLLPEH